MSECVRECACVCMTLVASMPEPLSSVNKQTNRQTDRADRADSATDSVKDMLAEHTHAQPNTHSPIHSNTHARLSMCVFVCLFVYFLPFGCAQVFFKLSYMSLPLRSLSLSLPFSTYLAHSACMPFSCVCHEYFHICSCLCLCRFVLRLYPGNCARQGKLRLCLLPSHRVYGRMCRALLFNRLL